MNHADNLMLNVQAKSFLAHDLLLYLDTHPDDREAFHAYRNALRDRCEAVRAYEQHVRSLSPDGMNVRSGFDWVDGPYPWQ